MEARPTSNMKKGWLYRTSYDTSLLLQCFYKFFVSYEYFYSPLLLELHFFVRFIEKQFTFAPNVENAYNLDLQSSIASYENL